MSKLINKYKNYHPSKWEILTFLLIPVFIGIISTINPNDDDIWFILSTGREIINNGFFSIDPFTIHENLHTVVQQWSFDVFVYLIFKYTGEIGLYFFINIMNILTIFVIYKFIKFLTNDKRCLSVIITFIISLLYIFEFLIIRPQLISTILLILELYVLEYYFKTNNKKVLWYLPLLSLLMINIHASIWPMMICFIIPFILNTFEYKIGKVESKKREKKPLIYAFIAVILVGFINPYGIESMFYLLNSRIGILSLIVAEMYPLDVNNCFGMFHFIIIVLIYIFYIVYKNKIQSRHLLLLLGTSFIALASYRGLLFVLIAGVYPISIYLSKYFKTGKDNSNKYLPFFILLAILIVVVPTIIVVKSDYISIKNKAVDHVDYVYQKEKNNIESVRLYCPYAVCTYAEYVGIKPYLDSRAELFLKINNKKDDILKEYYSLQENRIYYTDFINKYDFNYFILNRNDYLYLNLLHDNNYELVYKKTLNSKNRIRDLIYSEKSNVVYYVFKKKNF